MIITNTYVFIMKKENFKKFIKSVKTIKSINIIEDKNEKNQLFALENKKDKDFLDWNKRVYKVTDKDFGLYGLFLNVVFRCYWKKSYYVILEDCLTLPFIDLYKILTLINKYGKCISKK